MFKSHLKDQYKWLYTKPYVIALFIVLTTYIPTVILNALQTPVF